MVVCRHVKKVSDFLFIVMPDACPCNTPDACDTCSHSNVDFKISSVTAKSHITLGYVSCFYQKAQGPERLDAQYMEVVH